MAIHKSRKHSSNVGRAEVLKTLHSTFKKLLEEQRKSQHEVRREVKEKEQTKTDANSGQELPQDELVVPVRRKKRGRPRLSESTTAKRKRDTGVIQRKNGIIYIRSKERALIPNLSAEETLRRHKQADENMRRAWENIIQKYESINDDVEGDLVDLKTGRIVKDNGHLRRLSLLPSIRDPNTEYKTTLGDLFLGVDGLELPGQRHELEDGYSIHDESGKEEGEMGESILLDRRTDGDDFSMSSDGSYELNSKYSSK